MDPKPAKGQSATCVHDVRTKEHIPAANNTKTMFSSSLLLLLLVGKISQIFVSLCRVWFFEVYMNMGFLMTSAFELWQL